MVSDLLKANSRRRLLETLSFLASDAAMREYQRAVPPIHVPIELVCQWDQHASLLGHAWFRDLFTDVQWQSLTEFDALLSSFVTQCGGTLPDVDELLGHPDWPALSESARGLIETLGS